jgi:hypothetical protein
VNITLHDKRVAIFYMKKWDSVKDLESGSLCWIISLEEETLFPLGIIL